MFEPTNGQWGRRIRTLAREGRDVTPEEESELFLKDRMEDVALNIRPALEAGSVVVMDRYYYSNMAYQGALGLDMEDIRKRNEEFSPVPDAVVIIDVEPSTGSDRITVRKGQPDHFEGEDYQVKVREQYLKMERYPNVHIIDGQGDPEEVHGRVLEAVLRVLDPVCQA